MEMSAINTNTNTTKLVVYQIMIVIHSKFQGSAELAAILSFLTEMSPNFLVYLILRLSSFVLETEPMGPSRRGPVCSCLFLYIVISTPFALYCVFVNLYCLFILMAMSPISWL